MGGITLPNPNGTMPAGAFTPADQQRLNESVAAAQNSVPLTQRMADVNQAQNGLGMKDDEIYSRIRGLGPGLAANRLEKAGVDVRGLIGERTGQGFNEGPGAFSGSGNGVGSKNADVDESEFKRGGSIKNKSKANVVKKMAQGGYVGASSRGDGCAQRGKTKGRFV
jgi:hypothetical protein